MHLRRHFVSRKGGWPMCGWFFMPDLVLAAVVALCQKTDPQSPTFYVHGSVATTMVDRGHEFHHHPSAFGQI